MQASFSKLELGLFINKSDGETAMKALKDAAAKAPRRGREHFTRIASGRPPSKRCHRVDSEDVEGTYESEVCTGEQAGTTALHMTIRF